MNALLTLPGDPLWLPHLEAWLIALLGAAALFGAIAGAARTTGIVRLGPHMLRVLGLLGICLLLFNPSMPAPAPPFSLPSLTILIDTSRSMSLPSADGASESRIDAMRNSWRTPAFLARLSRSADVRLLSFADRAATVEAGASSELQATGDATRLNDAIEAALTALRPASEAQVAGSASASRILTLSDANDTTGRDPKGLVRAALARGSRLDFVLPASAGEPEGVADVAVEAAPRRPLLAASDRAEIDVSLTQRGFNGQTVVLKLEQIAPVRRVLAERQVTLGEDSTFTLAVTPELPPDAERGVHAVECVASIAPLAAELDIANNTDPFFLQVTDAQVRVALFEGEPSWDSRFFVAALSEDPRFEITTVHALGSRAGAASSTETIRTRRITPGVARSSEETGIPPPLAREALGRFDIVVLGNRIEALFPAGDSARLASFVSEGSGSLVLLRGDPVSDSGEPSAVEARRALAPILPLRFEDSATEATALFALPAGVRALGAAAATLEEAPDIESLERVRDLSPLSSTWLAGFDTELGVTAPALVTAPASNGRVLVNLAKGFWRWQLLPPDRQGWRRALAAFWPQVMMALAMGNQWAPGQDVSLAVDRVTAAPGDPITVVVRARGPLAGVLQPVVAVRSTALAGESTLGLAASPVQAGVWTGTITAQDAGVLTVSLPATHAIGSELTTRVRIRNQGDEMLHTQPDHAHAAGLAQATGGAVFSVTDAERYLELIESEAIAGRTDTVVRPVWRRAWVFWLVVCAFAFEWFWRRRIGLA